MALDERVRVGRAAIQKPRAMERVTIDTTVQTKAVAYPTDGHRAEPKVSRG